MPTRIYLPSSGAAAISPAFDATWNNTTLAGTRLAGVTTTIGSTMTTSTFTDSNDTTQWILHRQWVFGPISAQTIGVQTVKLQIRASEVNSLNNMFCAWGIRVVAPDASTFRGTILAVDTSGSEFAVTTLTNRANSRTSTSVTATAGDYLVIEVGAAGNPGVGGDHDSSMRIGDSGASDLPEDSSSTSDLNPWIEFANEIFYRKSFIAPRPPLIRRSQFRR